MDKITYVVWREGVYMQGIYGVFDDFHSAIDHAEILIGLEEDDYHKYHVSEFNLNNPLHMDDEDHWMHPRAKATITKHKKEIAIKKNY